MSDNYYLTSDVHVFPSTHRKTGTGKYTNEQNFINILNSLTDCDSYVLSYDKDSRLLKVIIHGYYFEIANFIPKSDLKLAIRLETESESLVSYSDTSVTTLDKIVGADVESSFIGLFYGTSIEQDENSDYKKYILQVCDDEGNIINKYRFSTESILYDENKDLATKLDEIDNEKQNNLTVSTGLALRDDELSLDASAVKKNVLEYIGGDTNQFVYFDNKGDIKTPGETVNIGHKADNTDLNSSTMIVKEGKFVKGQTMFISQDDPDKNLGEIGDIWFKY